MSAATQTIEFLDFIFDLAEAAKMSKQDDGKITLRDAPKFFGAAWKAPVALGGIEQIPKELSNHNPEGKFEVLTYLRSRFELADAELEYLYEDTVAAGFELASVLERWTDRRKTQREL